MATIDKPKGTPGTAMDVLCLLMTGQPHWLFNIHIVRPVEGGVNGRKMFTCRIIPVGTDR
jgi:hypothetical protein